MSFISIIGLCLFFFLLFIIKNNLNIYKPIKSSVSTDENNKQVITPAQPANYFGIIVTIIIGILFLGFVMAGVVYMRNLSLFGGVIKL